MEAALVVCQGNNSRLLKQVCQDFARLDLGLLRLNRNLEELAEAGRVQILGCLRVAESLKHWVRLHYIVLDVQRTRVVAGAFALGRLLLITWRVQVLTKVSSELLDVGTGDVSEDDFVSLCLSRA